MNTNHLKQKIRERNGEPKSLHNVQQHSYPVDAFINFGGVEIIKPDESCTLYSTLIIISGSTEFLKETLQGVDSNIEFAIKTGPFSDADIDSGDTPFSYDPNQDYKTEQ
ncbi:hypothetical protein CYV19_12955 [Natronobacterium gregoryi SP2]|nr:hypothetical protein CYV19_12955 [Natronobacterium gregoryi SP2]